MMSEKMREEFQNWLADEYELNSEWLEDRNCFKDYSAHIAYKAWIASRAALCVELPADRSLSASDDPWYVLEYCRDAIHADGVSTK